MKFITIDDLTLSMSQPYEVTDKFSAHSVRQIPRDASERADTWLYKTK